MAKRGLHQLRNRSRKDAVKGNPKRLTEADKDRIMQMWADGGVSTEGIALAVGRSKRSVERVLREAGMKRSERVEVQQAIDLYRATDMSTADIQKHTGVAHVGRRAVGRGGLTRRDQTLRKMALLGYEAGGAADTIAQALGVSATELDAWIVEAGVTQEQQLDGVDWAVNTWLRSDLNDSQIQRLTGVFDPRWKARKMGITERDPHKFKVMSSKERARRRGRSKAEKDEKKRKGEAALRRLLRGT